MTAIVVTYPEGRIDGQARAELAETLTDAVLIIECGQVVPMARSGFQVHFRPLANDHIAIGGKLLSDQPADILHIDAIVMDGHWPDADRAAVIANMFAALCKALKVDAPSPAWWINFRVIEEGSWGSRGGVLSILSLLDTGAFAPERAADIRASIAGDAA
jgi:phenylpyruvate tautomerase PptA (4-oxalocrotonate tautomerase family)